MSPTVPNDPLGRDVRFRDGKLGDTADFVEWAGDYQQYLGLLEELRARLKAAG